MSTPNRKRNPPKKSDDVDVVVAKPASRAKKTAPVVAPPPPVKNIEPDVENDSEEESPVQEIPPIVVPTQVAPPLNTDAPLFHISMLRGYNARKMFDVTRVKCKIGIIIIYPKEKIMRFQAISDVGTDSQTCIFYDVIYNNTVFNMTSEENFNMSFNLNDITQRCGLVRRTEGLTFAYYAGKSTFQIYPNNNETCLSHVTLHVPGMTPHTPPSMGVNPTPSIILDTRAFCTALAAFMAPKIRTVKVTMYGNYMDWIGYMDDTTRITENRFITKEDSPSNQTRYPPTQSDADIPGCTFYLSKKDVTSFCKFKQIPPEEVPLKIYHNPGGPIMLQFNVGNIGQAEIYIMNAKSV